MKKWLIGGRQGRGMNLAGRRSHVATSKEAWKGTYTERASSSWFSSRIASQCAIPGWGRRSLELIPL